LAGISTAKRGPFIHLRGQPVPGSAEHRLGRLDADATLHSIDLRKFGKQYARAECYFEHRLARPNVCHFEGTSSGS
jgi:hypothetical protein